MRRIRRWAPGLLLVAPSLLVLGIFVYGFMGWTLRLSLTSSRRRDINWDYVGAENYRELADETTLTGQRFAIDVKNIVIFTLAFVVGSLVVGFFLALLLDRGVVGESFFRGVYIFPMAISFIAIAIVWRWLLNNGTGDQLTGLNKLFSLAGLDFLQSDWFKSDSGFAIAAVALPAGWALSGYVMALFLAGMRGVPEDLREAARVDGAREHQVFWHVVRPMLLPVTMSALVILVHISLKTFDLIYAMDLKSLKIDTPALFMWFTTFEGGFFGSGAAIATLLLFGVSLVIIPYIWYSVRAERRS
ncbi:MAG TPA: sugar ABC transporter permease [Micromonosporaceae bacterium]|nr:sugar ABC transporter permease [Micromonosporaceae bacterium]